MNTTQAEQLSQDAKPYLDREIEVNVSNDFGKTSSKTICIFKSWVTVSITESGGQPNYQLNAKLDDKANGNTYSASLESIIKEFKRLDSLK